MDTGDTAAAFAPGPVEADLQAERFSLQLTEGIHAGRDLLVGNMTAEKAR